MRHQQALLRILLAAAASWSCGDDGSSSGTGATGGTADNSTGGTGNSPSATGGHADAGNGSNDSGGSDGTAGAVASAGTGGAQSFPDVGVCGQRGQSTVNTSSFEGFEEFYIIGDEGFGDDICVVRFDVTRVGAGPAGCDDPAAGVECLWTHLVEYSNPSVVTDIDEVCANSELALGDTGIAAIDGTRVAYGFVSEYVGHNSVIMKYDDAAGTWSAYGNATWDEEADAFRFDRRDGYCGY